MARTQTPKAPEVPLELWRELYEAAAQFQKLAPWQWMDSDQLFGINNQHGVRMVAVMGRMGTVFGVASYCGTLGINFVLRLLRGEIEPESFESSFGQDALQLDLALRKELRKEDLAVMNQLGFQSQPSRPKRFPKFSSFKPGYFPWFLNETEARTLLDDIRKTILFAGLLQRHPKLFDSHGPDDFPFLREPVSEPLSPDQLEWHTMVPSEEAPFAPVDPCQFHPDTLKKLSQLPGEVWELMGFYSNASISGEGPRPFWPRMGLAVDSMSGRVMGFHLSPPPLTFADAAAGALVEAIKELGARPSTVQVDSPNLQAALQPLAKALDLKLHLVTSLPMAAEARQALLEYNRQP